MEIAAPIQKPKKDKTVSVHAPVKTPDYKGKEESNQIKGVPIFLRRSMEGIGPPAIQAKLTVGDPDDEYEKEADTVAEQVMRLPESTVGLRRPIDEIPQIQTKSDHSPSGLSSPSITNAVNLSAGGTGLSRPIRSRMEPVLGADLSDVRVHNDSSAQLASQHLNALAFTHRNNIFLGKGQSPLDVKLLAHELTHVVQQRAAPSPGLQLQSPADASTAVEQRPRTSPVVWGMDTENSRLYVSVRAPARTLSEVVQYVYGSLDLLGTLQSQNGISDAEQSLAPGRTLTLGAGRLSDAAYAEMQASTASGLLTRTEGIPAAGESETQLYRFQANGQAMELTETQLRGVVTGLSVVLKRHAWRLRSTAETTLEVQRDHIKNTNSVVRGISDWWGDADLPSEFTHLLAITAGQGLENDLTDFDTSDAVAASHKIERMARRLQTLANYVDASTNVWRSYINATISGAEGVTQALEITRDVSFGVAIGIGAVVAFPVVASAAAVTTTVGTGVGATLVAGGTVVAGGAGAGAVLRGGSSIAGQGLFNDNIDWGQVGSDTSEGARRGAVDAFVGVIAPGVSSGATRLGGTALTRVAGQQAVENAGVRLGTSAVGRFALRAGQHVPGAMAIGGAHAGLTEVGMGRPGNAPKAMLHGALMGALFGVGGAAAQPLLQRVARLLPPSFSLRPRVNAFHGTTSAEGAAAVRSGNAQMRGGPNDDFGRAFYATRDPAVAANAGGRFAAPGAAPAEVVGVTVPMRWRDYLGIGRPAGDSAFLNLRNGCYGQRWQQFMQEPAIPGSATTRGEAYFSGRAQSPFHPGSEVAVPADVFRNQWYRRFLAREGLAAPGIVEGALPQNLPGATQIAISSQRVMDMVNEAARYNPAGFAQLIEGLFGSAAAASLNGESTADDSH